MPRRPNPWPDVKVVSAKGRLYYYWKRSQPMTPLPDPAREPDAFMRKLAHLRRVEIKSTERAKTGTLPAIIGLYRKSDAFTKRKPKTQKVYGIYLDQLVELFPGAHPNEVTSADVQLMMDSKADKPGAAAMLLRMLHIVYKWGGKRGYVRDRYDPTLDVDEHELGEHEPWPDHVLDAALMSTDDVFRAAVVVYYFTGQRTGDCCNMTWEAEVAGGIAVRQEKTDEPLIIPKHPILAAELDRLRPLRRSATDPILSNRNGDPLRPATMRDWCKAFAATFKGEKLDLVPHGLRKNAVNALLEVGCSTAEVGGITGQSLQTIEHYAKRRNKPKLARAAMAKWTASTKRERENSDENGKPAS